MKHLKFSALDTGILTFDQNPSDGIEESKKLIRELENLGYHRFWLGEHHESHYSWTRPSILIPYLASQTKSIRLGTAAVLIGLYPALQLAEDYRTLTTMFPNRIDYGICSAVPECEDSRAALLDGKIMTFPEVAKNFESKLIEMHSYLHNNYPAGHRFENGATPIASAGDTSWIMGTGMGSAILAAKHSVSFSYSLFHKRSLQDASVVKYYQDNFTPNFNKKTSSTNIAISVICADDINEAIKQKEWVNSLGSSFRVNIVGKPETCYANILELCKEYQTGEVVIYMMWHNYEKRIKAFKSLAAYFK